jgi:FMN phosphatase YigB (HAD superfamily)
MPEIKAVIFDLGNVLIDFDHRIGAKRIAHFCDKSPEEIYSLFFASRITTLFEEGKITPQDFFLKVKEMLNLRLDFEAFVPIWDEIFFFSAKNREVFSLANNLRYYCKTAVLSNINTLHFEYLKKHFPIFKIFHHVFTSFELGAAKPDQAIYRKALEALGLVAEEVFYVDDRQELVESARLIGIESRVFVNASQLRTDLFNLGLEVN